MSRSQPRNEVKHTQSWEGQRTVCNTSPSPLPEVTKPHRIYMPTTRVDPLISVRPTVY